MSTITFNDPYLAGARMRSWAYPLIAIGCAGVLAGSGAMLALALESGIRSAGQQASSLGSMTSVLIVWVGIMISWIAAGKDSRAMAAGHLPGPAPDQPTRARRMLQTEHLTWLPTATVLSLPGIAGVIYLGYGVTLGVTTLVVIGLCFYVRWLRNRLGVVMNRRFLPRLRG